MEHFPDVLTRAESDAMVERIEAHFERYGFGLWAVEVRERRSFIGFVGLAVPSFEAHFTPCVEVGWRLAQQCWGLGYATEAARAAVTFGFGQLPLEEIVSFTVPENERSRRVMNRLGMTYDPADDFDHPKRTSFEVHALIKGSRIIEPPWPEDAWERAVEATNEGRGSLFDPWVLAAPALLDFIDEP